MKKLNIYANQIGITYKNGEVIKVYTQGEYYIPLFRQVVVYDMSAAFFPAIEMNILLQHDGSCIKWPEQEGKTALALGNRIAARIA